MGYDRAAEADRKPLEEFSIDCLCPDTIQRYRMVFAANKPTSPWNADSKDDFLYHIGAVSKGRNGELNPTKAGLIAFGYEYEITRYRPQFLLDYREETSGRSRWDDRVCSQSGDWSGNAVDFYLTVTERMIRYFKAPFSAGEKGVRHGVESPITEAVNEAIANAIAHAHYGSAASVKVLLRPDGVEVTNTGDFLIDRRVAIAGGFSETRNPTLMRILSLIGATDRAGSGLQTIWSVWEGHFGREPQLEEVHSPSYVRLSLPLEGMGKRAPAERGTRHRAAILEILGTEQAGLSAVDVHNALGISERVAQMSLKDLFEDGLVRRERLGRQFIYTLA